MQKRKDKVSITWVNHLIGFISVAFGVLFAFWLNNISEDRKQQQTVDQALTNIRNELARNKQKIDSVYQSTLNQIDFIDFYVAHMKETMDIDIPANELPEALAKYPDYLEKDGKGVSVHFNLFQLSDVAWKTSQNAGVLPYIDFDLAYKLAETYNTQSKLDDFDATIVSDVRTLNEGKHAFERLALSARATLNFARQLTTQDYAICIEQIDRQLEK